MKAIPFLIVAILFTLTGCDSDHFITDRNYREKVDRQFAKRKKLVSTREKELFSVFDQKDLTTAEREALEFIYAFSSLNDLADYNGDFFLQNVRASFEARDTFSWGKKIPEDIFRHFVLPVRVNNENLDSSRWVFMGELKHRLRSLTMEQAVLEVNHWCHEKVTYKGTDIRTSSPLATVKTAYGRCGEESTFTVAALRSVAIPARQCYTPRWAHCDDNHAWVEVWVDGKWHFIGACEPDVALDLAWFAKPAKRAMLVNTTVFGDYEGPEDVLLKDELFTRINVLENYAPTRKVCARVLTPENRPADSAVVEFQLYNYAEFYPLHRTITDKNGTCTFRTGLGDLVVRATAKGLAGFKKLDVRKEDTVTIILAAIPEVSLSTDLDLAPPVEMQVDIVVSDSARKVNNDRLAFEDKLRAGYEASFTDSAKAVRFAALVALNPDTMWHFLRLSRGNWREISSFITEIPKADLGLVFPLLGVISEKDLRDVNPAVLSEAIVTSRDMPMLSKDREEFYRFVLSPRVDNEWLRPHRQKLISGFDASFIASARQDPGKLAAWTLKNIVADNTGSYSRAPITPLGVWELRRADDHSRDIFFVALCRSFGIPASLDPATKIPRYYSNGKWTESRLTGEPGLTGAKSSLTLTNPASNGKVPEYYIHYTVGEMKEGFYRSLDYEGSPLVKSFPFTLEIPSGPSLLVTGTRLTDGTVLARLNFFVAGLTNQNTLPVELRKTALSKTNYGKINTSLVEGADKGLLLLWIEPGKEPTRHLLADLREKKGEFSRWTGKIVMILPTEASMKEFVAREKALLPGNISFSFQATFPIPLKEITIGGTIPGNMPVVILADKSGVITYFSEGYRIGTGQDLLDRFEP